MPTILDEIVANTVQEVAQRKVRLSQNTLEAQVTTLAQPRFLEAMALSGDTPYRFILEIKPASPSAGTLATDLALPERVRLYQNVASALSVLTDSRYFGGSFGLLQAVSQHTGLPLLCKDFVVDPYQVLEARHAGAYAVLLIVKILTDEMLSQLHQAVLEMGMTPVVEVQTEAELDRALAVNPQVILINNRNLSDFNVSFETTRRLAPLVPTGVVAISASGFHTGQEVAAMLPVCQRFLVGSALMRHPLEALPTHLEALLPP